MVNRPVFWLCAVLLFSACTLPSYYNDYESRFDWRDEFRFLTPADRAPSPGEEYSFIVVSDIHIGGARDALDFTRLGEKLNGAQFIVITGDVTNQGSREELRLFIEAARSLGVPCYPAAGNHDIYTERGKPWRELIGSTMYRIDAGGASLFILDNANAAFGYDQLDWLETQLRRAGKNTFVFFHENLFVEASPPDFEQTTDIRERAKIMSALKGRAGLVFMGHIHRRMEKEFGGVRYITLENYGATGGTGGFCRVRVSSGGVSWEFDRVVF
ncbi:MAG: metallophosphoesterase [Treponema sp.]|jgi:3',5'-cyclic AMP phosphodiesterase CpdA|nr:metallophosphoesterase [Treponema sp.]